MNVFRSRRGLVGVGLAILLGLFLIRPGATRLKVRIATSVGLALQREVEIDRVRLRLLPQPGFELENFVVHDDPAFSAEPVLRVGNLDVTRDLSDVRDIVEGYCMLLERGSHGIGEYRARSSGRSRRRSGCPRAGGCWPPGWRRRGGGGARRVPSRRPRTARGGHCARALRLRRLAGTRFR